MILLLRRQWRTGLLLTGLLILTLAACGSDDPAHEITAGEPLYRVAFDAPDSWEVGSFPPDAELPQSVLAVADGRYLIDHVAERSSSFIWGAGGDAVEDVVIEVQAEQINDYKNNLYGVACRLGVDDDGEVGGYALVISGDAHYGIARLENRSLSFVLEWHQSAAINEGRAANTIRAACVDDYLALWVNDEFVGDAIDDTYPRAGQVGLIAGVNSEHRVSVAFDDLTVSDAAFAE